MTNAVTSSCNFYRGYPPLAEQHLAVDTGRTSYGHLETAFTVASPPGQAAQPRVTEGGGVADTSGVMESDSHSSGTDEDVISVCSLDGDDVTSGLNAPAQIEAS